jgi:hypothetical protein
MNEFTDLSPEDAEYVLNLPHHLTEGYLADDLGELLTNYEFIEYKILHLFPQRLIEDYELALCPNIQISPQIRESLKLIQSSIRLSANVLIEDKKTACRTTMRTNAMYSEFRNCCITGTS